MSFSLSPALLLYFLPLPPLPTSVTVIEVPLSNEPNTVDAPHPFSCGGKYPVLETFLSDDGESLRPQ
jgi:hypothetical protein